MKLEKGFKQILIKSIIFIVLFMLFSFVIGTKLYANNLLEGWKLSIYGRVGYIILFSLMGFILIYREKLLGFGSFKYKKLNLLFLMVSFALLAGFYVLEMNIEKVPLNFLNIIFVHVFGLSIFVFLIMGIYGLNFISYFVKKFRKELIYFLIFGVVTASLMNLVWSLWPYLSLVVLKSVNFLLGFFGNVQIIDSNTIIFEGFGAKIAEACSGIYSVFIFSALYLFAVFLDWKKINKLKAGLIFIPAVLGAFLVNILRVFLLMIVGAYVSRDIALGLYHSYTGMIFFLVYFAVFWSIFYKKIKKVK